ncbi:unnamed protein product [Amoebophrya sp. A120]|nr:unnamed protein product [Amoebophrya sp. A120]|eukprot:GSA120T00011186001.1
MSLRGGGGSKRQSGRSVEGGGPQQIKIPSEADHARPAAPVHDDLPASLLALQEEFGREKFQILRPEHDFVGPLMNLWPVLPGERDPKTFLVTANDDHLQPRNFIRDLWVNAIANPGRAICYHGWISVFDSSREVEQQHDLRDGIDRTSKMDEVDAHLPMSSTSVTSASPSSSPSRSDQDDDTDTAAQNEQAEATTAQSLSYNMTPSEIDQVTSFIHHAAPLNRTAGLHWLTRSTKTPTYVQQEYAPNILDDTSASYYATAPVGANYLGCIWQRGFFDDNLYRLVDREKTFSGCLFVDDVWRAALMAMRKIRFLFLNRLPTGSTPTELNQAERAVVDGLHGVALANVQALGKEKGKFSSANMRATCHKQLVREWGSGLWQKKARRVLVTGSEVVAAASHFGFGEEEDEGKSTGASGHDHVPASADDQEAQRGPHAAPALSRIQLLQETASDAEARSEKMKNFATPVLDLRAGSSCGAPPRMGMLEKHRTRTPSLNSENKAVAWQLIDNFDRIYLLQNINSGFPVDASTRKRLHGTSGATPHDHEHKNCKCSWEDAASWEGDEDTEICVDTSTVNVLFADSMHSNELEIMSTKLTVNKTAALIEDGGDRTEEKKNVGLDKTKTSREDEQTNLICFTVASFRSWYESGADLRRKGTSTRPLSAKEWRKTTLTNLIARVPGFFHFRNRTTPANTKVAIFEFESDAKGDLSVVKTLD